MPTDRAEQGLFAHSGSGVLLLGKMVRFRERGKRAAADAHPVALCGTKARTRLAVETRQCRERRAERPDNPSRRRSTLEGPLRAASQ